MKEELNIIRLTAEHNILPFDCGDSDINDFLINDAKAYQEKLLAVTYLVESAGNTVLYFCLSNDKITSIETGNVFWRKVKSIKTGCRFITVDAYKNAVPFYEKNGFLFMGNNERQRYLSGKYNTIAMYFDLRNVL